MFLIITKYDEKRKFDKLGEQCSYQSKRIKKSEDNVINISSGQNNKILSRVIRK